jgi:lipopolysaccharide export system permease protein
MRLEFFPSPSLTRYLAKLFIVRILAVLIMLVLVLQTLDLLSESGKILGVPGNGQAELWHYISLRTPGSCPIRCCWPRSLPSPR